MVSTFNVRRPRCIRNHPLDGSVPKARHEKARHGSAGSRREVGPSPAGTTPYPNASSGSNVIPDFRSIASNSLSYDRSR